MSVAPCFADTNDLAVDPATTAEDTQRTPESILSHSGVLLAICLALAISHAYLSLSFHLRHLSFLSLPPSVTKDAISLSRLPQTLFLSL